MGIKGVIKLFLKLIKWPLAIYVLTIIGLIGFNIIYGITRPDTPRPADVVVVLAGGMEADGTLSRQTVLRTYRGLELIVENRAPRIAFTGGKSDPEHLPSAFRMANIAEQAGMPSILIAIETQAKSTLQNAVYSVGIVDDLKSIILVTDGYHLPRTWASFKWARNKDYQLARTGTLKNGDRNTLSYLIYGYAREGIAIWYSVYKVALFHTLDLFGVSVKTRLDYLN
jgi:uncharacterized SAM-binding protein YcdF (DUF218 family)